MQNILYIHGFGSNHNATTFQELKSSFPDYTFFSDDFDLLNVSETLKKIQDLCSRNGIDIIIGKSLGAFYTLAYEGIQKKIVINPCMKPWVKIPKLDNSIPEAHLSEWQQIFEKTKINIDSEKREHCFGIFGEQDHLFSYKDFFDELYSSEWVSLQKAFLISGVHHIQIENLKPVKEEAIARLIKFGYSKDNAITLLARAKRSEKWIVYHYQQCPVLYGHRPTGAGVFYCQIHYLVYRIVIWKT